MYPRNVVKMVSVLCVFSVLSLGMSSARAQMAALPDFTELVEKNGGAVVNISTTQKVKHPNVTRGAPKNMPELPEGPFGDLFRHFFGEEGPGQGPESGDLDTQSLGSGFIISADGYVLTNYHVIKDAKEVVVRLVDRRELEAKIVGSDPRSDMALLKISGDNLPVVKIGDSDTLKVGEWVLAIGSPFGFDYSVTAGIVSAKGRSLPSENYVPFIQTDVAINPGNSGGPLFDLEGNVVGINSQIYSRTGGFMGLSFAIPINVAMSVVQQIKTKGHVVRGWLGVLIQDVTGELAESFGMDKPRGALVAKILPGSPAEKAGFQVGDVVVKFNGRSIVHSSDLPPLVGVTPVGEKVDVELLREGRSKVIKIVLGELPEETAEQAAVTGAGPGARDVENKRMNIAVVDLEAAQREGLELQGKGGVLVTRIEEGPARKAGLRRGDVILMVDSKNVKDVAQFQKLVKELPTGKSVPLLVQRQGAPVFLALKVE